MTGIVRDTKTIDSRYRVALPREWANVGDEVYFEITKTGNLVVKKIKKEIGDKETPL